MQACVEFFTKRIVNQALTRHARKPLKGGCVHRKVIVCLPTGTRAGMPLMCGGLIRQHKVNRRKSLA